MVFRIYRNFVSSPNVEELNNLYELLRNQNHNQEKYVFIKDAELNKDMTKLTYKITDWREMNMKLYSKSITLKPKVFVDIKHKPTKLELSNYEKKGTNYILKQTTLMTSMSDKDSYDKIVKKLTEFMGKPLDKKIITNIKSKFKKMSDTNFNKSGVLQSWSIRDMKDTYIILYTGKYRSIETIIKK